MDTLLSGLSAGGIGGVIIAIAYLAYRCCRNKKVKSDCCGAKLDVQEESPRRPPVIAKQESV